MNLEKAKLSKIAFVVMGQSPEGETYNNEGRGVPLLNGPTEFGETHPECTLYTEDSKRESEIGDLIFCVRGSTTGRMNWSDKVYSLGRGVCAIRGENKLMTKFIKYSLDMNLSSLLQFSGGSTFPNLSRDDILNFEVYLPKHPERIAEILERYDELIENYQRQIAILEATAQNIYREWFVRGRYPFAKYEKDSKLPVGWKEIKIGDVCTIARGSSPRPINDEAYFVDGTIPWIKIADATASGKFLYETKEQVNEYGASFSRYLDKGSLIIATSGTLGFCILLGVRGCVHDGWLYISEYKNGVTPSFMYFVINSLTEYFNNLSYGAAIQNINTDILRETQMILPSEDALIKFQELINPIDNKIDNLSLQLIQLREMRDKLLPRLLSGKIPLAVKE